MIPVERCTAIVVDDNVFSRRNASILPWYEDTDRLSLGGRTDIHASLGGICGVDCLFVFR